MMHIRKSVLLTTHPLVCGLMWIYKNDLKRLRHPFQTFTLHTQVIWPLALSTNLKAYQRRPFQRVLHTPFYFDHTTPLLFSFKAIWNTKGQPCTRPYFKSTVKKITFKFIQTLLRFVNGHTSNWAHGVTLFVRFFKDLFEFLKPKVFDWKMWPQ